MKGQPENEKATRFADGFCIFFDNIMLIITQLLRYPVF